MYSPAFASVWPSVGEVRPSWPLVQSMFSLAIMVIRPVRAQDGFPAGPLAGHDVSARAVATRAP